MSGAVERTPDAAADDGPARTAPPDMSGRRMVGAAALALVIAIAVSFVASALIVRNRLLDSETYNGALVEARAYDRIYTEILADPELVEIAHGLLGERGVRSELSHQATALTTNALRLALPPDRVRGGVEHVLDQSLAYIRGDVDAFEGRVELSPLLDSVDDAVVVHRRAMLAQGAARVFTTLVSYEDAVVTLLDDIAAGEVPTWFPIPAEDIDVEAVVDLLLVVSGNTGDDELHAQLYASLVAGDERAALIAAASGSLEQLGLDTVAALMEPGGGSLDVVEAIAVRAETTANGVIAGLDRARDMAAVLGPVPTAIAALVGLAALGALIAIAGGRHRFTAALAGLAFAVAAVLTAIAWRAIGNAIAAPLRAAVGTGEGSWGLPSALNAVLADVFTAVGAQLRTGVVRVLVVLAVVAVALAGGVLITSQRIRLPRMTRQFAVGALGLVAAGAAWGAVRGAQSLDAPARACNGAAELCDRRYDEVAYAATHNSMSSPFVVRIWPEHDSFLRGQLDAGVRALLIDTHYWPPVGSARALVDAAGPGSLPLPEPVADVVFRGLGSLAAGRPGTFLCHNHCAFGAIEASVGLGEVRGFLDDNPGEVVTLIIQDVISPEDTVTAMDDAGLTPYLYPHDHGGGAWPTLGELIDRGTRLVVFAEDAGPPPDWYANAFEAMQETPFLVIEQDRFTCDHSRGDPDATLFLLNHWVQRVAPDPADAAVVNAYDFLLSRALQCQEERGLLPNFVAVNFYSIGDVIDVVATLNGLDVRR